MVKKIVFTLLALLSWGVCQAQLGFYIENNSIYSPDDEDGCLIEVPIKARFNTWSSACYIHMQLPQGVELRIVEDDENGDEMAYRPGSDMKRTDNLVWRRSESGAFNLVLYNVSANSENRSRPANSLPYDMFSLFLYVPWDFSEGEIEILTEYVNREFIFTFDSSANWLMSRHDLNGDGEFNISDINLAIDWILEYDGASYYLSHYNDDVLLCNIVSVDRIIDLIITGETYTGYQLVKTRNKGTIRKAGNAYSFDIDIAGDMDSDGMVTIADVTALIDYLLSGDASIGDVTNADCDDDGQVNISDVTALIDYLLSGTW